MCLLGLHLTESQTKTKSGCVFEKEATSQIKGIKRELILEGCKMVFFKGNFKVRKKEFLFFRIVVS